MASSDTVDPLPHELHTNRELEFMLNKGKPLAHFSDAYASEPDEKVIPELAFARYVRDGKFVMREFVEPLREPTPQGHHHVRGIRHVFYAQSAEAS
jgi:hypothetical protein